MQGAQTASRPSSRFGFCKDALFIFRVIQGVGPPLGFGHHFRIRPRSHPRIGARFGWRCTALRLATLAFAPFRASQPPRGKRTPREFPFISAFFLLALLLIN